MSRHVGLDFGTTNSSLAIVDDDGAVAVTSFQLDADSVTESFRSVVYFDQPRKQGLSVTRSPALAGPAASARYLRAEPKGRLVQSLKSFAASSHFTTTNIFGKVYTFEHLVALIVKALTEEATAQYGPLGTAITVGRPVAFVGAEDEAADALAIQRLTAALEACGFTSVRFAYEPIGAANAYDLALDRDELVLIADFGGGTSDFSLVRVGPEARATLSMEERILGNEGVALAGDSFDASLIRHLVSPQLGLDTTIRSSLGKSLPVPSWLFGRLERWHYLSFLKTETGRIRSLIAQADEPEKLEALLYIVENDLGYDLHQAVQRAKVDLSAHASTTFNFQEDDLSIVQEVARTDFEHWIQPHLASVTSCVEGLLTSARIEPDRIDRVFLTGGSSFVPAVRDIFYHTFGADRVSMGDEFTSVARGLALLAAEQDRRAP